jgi:hypothetical protein
MKLTFASHEGFLAALAAGLKAMCIFWCVFFNEVVADHPAWGYELLAESGHVWGAEKVSVKNVSEDPHACSFVHDCSDVVIRGEALWPRLQGVLIPGIDNCFGWEIESMRAVWPFWEFSAYENFRALAHNEGWRSSVIFDAYRYHGPLEASLPIGRSHFSKIQVSQDELRQFDSKRSASAQGGRLGCNPGGFVGAKQKADLSGGDDGKQRSEYAQNESIEGDRVIPSLLPDRRQRLPEGFGYVMLFGAFIGLSIGTLYVLLLLWLQRRN